MFHYLEEINLDYFSNSCKILVNTIFCKSVLIHNLFIKIVFIVLMKLKNQFKFEHLNNTPKWEFSVYITLRRTQKHYSEYISLLCSLRYLVPLKNIN